MNEKQTREFVKIWNKRNGFPDGIVKESNMRYVEPGVVTWNEYDAPEVNLAEFKEILTIIERS